MGVCKVTWLSKLNLFSVHLQGLAMYVMRKVIGKTNVLSINQI